MGEEFAKVCDTGHEGDFGFPGISDDPEDAPVFQGLLRCASGSEGICAPSPLLIATGEAIPLRGLEGVPGLAHVCAKLLQSCLILCDPIDGSPPGSPVPGILQARTACLPSR